MKLFIALMTAPRVNNDYKSVLVSITISVGILVYLNFDVLGGKFGAKTKQIQWSAKMSIISLTT